jgi:hypothetical protein
MKKTMRKRLSSSGMVFQVNLMDIHDGSVGVVEKSVLLKWRGMTGITRRAPDLSYGCDDTCSVTSWRHRGYCDRRAFADAAACLVDQLPRNRTFYRILEARCSNTNELNVCVALSLSSGCRAYVSRTRSKACYQFSACLPTFRG